MFAGTSASAAGSAASFVGGAYLVVRDAERDFRESAGMEVPFVWRLEAGGTARRRVARETCGMATGR
ncbi:hypothetical protein GCM10009774_23700 [Cellulomonas gelida]|nr:hypothetical protein GCM10009774_23700 [Cellulomonas gelida]